ncbi:MAG: hypothetical protein J6A25_07710 [Lachnospiraceae bacterium]|nr:hypothetical protein [Lachnospiraceae bacterium]MBO5425384.1 hypothetical protein [Lachnospiraceae bacterium]
MKRYFLIRTADSERSSSYKKICETLEEAKKEVPNYADWWCSNGTCSIHEVDENFITYKVYYFTKGQPAGMKVWKEEN